MTDTTHTDDCNTAREEYVRAWAVYVRAWAAYNKVGDASDKARGDYERTWDFCPAEH